MKNPILSSSNFFLSLLTRLENHILTDQDDRSRNNLKYILYYTIYSWIQLTAGLLTTNQLETPIYIAATILWSSRMFLMKFKYLKTLHYIMFIECCTTCLVHSDPDRELLRAPLAIFPTASMGALMCLSLHQMLFVAAINLLTMFNYRQKAMQVFNLICPHQQWVGSEYYKYLAFAFTFNSVLGILIKLRHDSIIDNLTTNLAKTQNLNSQLQDNVNALNKANSELKEAKIAIEQALEGQDRLVSMVSHELRNPLNSLLGHLYLLPQETDVDKQREMFSIIKICGEAISHLLNDLLDSQKIRSGKFQLNNAPTNMYNLLEKMWKVNALRIKQKNISGQFYVSRNMPQQIETDSERLMQIIFNLVGNSIKFTEKGGIKVFVSWIDSNEFEQKKETFEFARLKTNKSNEEIIVNPKRESFIMNSQVRMPYDVESETRHTPHHNPKQPKLFSGVYADSFLIFNVNDLKIQEKLKAIQPKETNETAGFIKIEVYDTGCGVSQESKARLFQPFIQESSSVSQKYGGTGLGLFIIKNLVSTMQGTISLESEKNVGSDFLVLVPSQRVNPRQNSQEHINNNNSVAVANLSGHRALVVDDVQYNRLIIKAYLDKCAIETSFSSNGDEAFKIIAGKPDGYFSFVTMDIQMPLMDGITCVKKLRKFEEKEGREKSVGVIFVTANNDEREREDCLDPAGDIRGSFYMRKPVSFADFEHVVSQILHVKKETCVLIVDDDPFNRMILGNFLKGRKLDYDEATDGLEALNKVKSMEKRYGCIVMDCEMPAMDGITATQEIKKFLRQSKAQDVLIVGLSGHAEEAHDKKCVEAGMSEVFHKPVDFSKLLDRICKK